MVAVKCRRVVGSDVSSPGIAAVPVEPVPGMDLAACLVVAGVWAVHLSGGQRAAVVTRETVGRRGWARLAVEMVAGFGEEEGGQVDGSVAGCC